MLFFILLYSLKSRETSLKLDSLQLVVTVFKQSPTIDFIDLSIKKAEQTLLKVLVKFLFIITTCSIIIFAN